MNSASDPLSRIAMAALFGAGLFTAPAQADPAFGLGLSLAFGGGQIDSGVGIRIFSDDQRDSVVASVGVDYMFSSRSWRGTVGAAYLDDRAYVGVDLGYGLQGGDIDFGLSLGGLNQRDEDGGSGDATDGPTAGPS